MRKKILFYSFEWKHQEHSENSVKYFKNQGILRFSFLLLSFRVKLIIIYKLFCRYSYAKRGAQLSSLWRESDGFLYWVAAEPRPKEIYNFEVTIAYDSSL